jgi:hypothetical protein
MAVMVPQPPGVKGIGAVEQPDLTEHGIAIDEHPVTDTEVVVPQPASTGNIHEKIPVAEPVAGFSFPRPVKLAVRPIAVDPGFTEKIFFRLRRAKEQSAVMVPTSGS